MTSSEHDSQPSGPASRAVAVGWERIREAPGPVLTAYLLSLLLALPLAAAMQSSIAESLRHREAAVRLLQGWDGLWHRTFSIDAGGIDKTFNAGVVGIGAVLRSLDALLQGTLFNLPAPLLVAGVLYLLGWVLVSGGLLARFGGERGGVLTLGATHMPRMLSLAAIGWAGFAFVLGGLLPSLSAIVELQCRDVIDERIYAGWIIGKYAVVWAVMFAVRTVVDYAKVLAVAEPSRSLGACLAGGVGLCMERLRAVVGIQVILGFWSLLLLLTYWMIAPGADQANAFKILIAFGISQLSVIARVLMRAWSLASQQALALESESR